MRRFWELDQEPSAEVLDLREIPAERRAERLDRTFQELAPGEACWVTGVGDAQHYEHFLRQRYAGALDWLADFTLDGQWIVRVVRVGR
jgi:uncharacterized protein (DUF2249 family)